MAERITACDAIAVVEQHRNQVEAVIGSLEGRMHGMDQHLNAVDARLEAMMVEQQAMLALLSSQQQSPDSDQTQSDEHREQGWPGNRGAARSPTKMDFPRFSGDNPISWVFHSEQCFDCQGIVGNGKVRQAAVYFEGAAIRWFHWLVSQQGRPDCATLVKEPTSRFGPSAYLDYNVELSSIKQSGTVLEYQEHFEALTNIVRGWPLPALIGAFLAGLKDEIRIELQAMKPQTLMDCFELARMVEEKNERLHTFNRGTFSRT
ncbi:hypothetical protein EJ110_NYTH49522 [Nymphaea thermarum]|nr:hypothetical protein EJ110_NYTH49522 [Nymphaea thermarum]